MGTPTASLKRRYMARRPRGTRIGTASTQANRALDGPVDPLDRQGIGARHHDEVRVGAGVDRRLHAIDHFLPADDLLAGTVAAALGLDLILDVQAGGTELDERSDGAGYVECATTPVSASTRSSSSHLEMREISTV